MREFKKMITADEDLTKVQSNLQEYFRPITTNPTLDGVRVTGVSLSSSSVNAVNHTLGREPLGWILIRKKGAADVWDSQDSNALPTRTLALNCDADVEVDLWIF